MIPWKFLRNSQEFTQIWWTFSLVILPGIGYEKFLGMGYMKYTRMGYEKFLGFLGKISRNFRGFFAKLFLGVL